MDKKPFKFLRDRHNNRLHVWNRHRLTMAEVKAAFPNVLSQYKDGNAWVRTCRASSGQLMEIVYLDNPTHIFVITAYYV